MLLKLISKLMLIDPVGDEDERRLEFAKLSKVADKSDCKQRLSSSRIIEETKSSISRANKEAGFL